LKQQQQQHHGGTGSKALATTAAATRQHTLPSASCTSGQTGAQPYSLSEGLSVNSITQQFCERQQQLDKQPQQAVIMCRPQQQPQYTNEVSG
jgi:hypothetical protein